MQPVQGPDPPAKEKGRLAAAREDANLSSKPCHIGLTPSSAPRALSAMERQHESAKWLSRRDAFIEDVVRHDFDGGESKLLRALANDSYGMCRSTAVYPSFKCLAASAGLDASNLKRTLAPLINQKKIVIPTGGGGCFEFKLQPQAGLWRSVKEVIGREDYNENQKALREFAFEHDKSSWLIAPAVEDLYEAAADASLDVSGPDISVGPELWPTRQSDESGYQIAPQTKPATRQIDESPPAFKEDSRVQGSKQLEALKSSKLEALNAAPNFKPRRPGEEEFMLRLRKALGEDVYTNDGGKWRVRYRKIPGKPDRVLAEVERMIREGEVIKKPGGNMEDIWKRFL